MGRGQPVVHGEQACLCAKAQHHEEHRQQLQPRVLPGNEGAAWGKVQGGGIGVEYHDAEQHEEGPADGVVEVLHSAGNGVVGQLMEHQRHGAETGELVKDVHRYEVCRQSRPQQHPLRQKEEHIKPCLILGVTHVLHGVDEGQQPCHRRQGGEHGGHAVQLHGDGQGLRQMPDVGGIAASGHQCPDHQRRFDDLHSQQKREPPPAAGEGERCRQTGQQGQCDQENQHRWSPVPFRSAAE